MCGICGQYNFGMLEPVRHSEIEAMTRTITHRDSDVEGYYIAGPLGFGFRRLSIIDLAGGHQPMSDQEESVWVIFNGEIYNFHDLKSELEAHGHVFRTKSDTEVIVHGYKQWGDELLNRLNGMFGLAIWDVRQRRLVLARSIWHQTPLLPNRPTSPVFRLRDAPCSGSDDRRKRNRSISLNLFLRYRYTPSPPQSSKVLRSLLREPASLSRMGLAS